MSADKWGKSLVTATPSVVSAQEIVKRGFDLTAAALALIVTLPLSLIALVLIRLDSPGPAIFRQRRVGRHGIVFTLWKFRSMRWGTPDIPTDQMSARSDSQITRLGAFLRRSSLDELPQLINVLKGEMSIVGPRPSLPSQERLNALRRARGVEELRPGITGWAQVNGRDELSDDAKVECDAYYRENMGLRLDIIILARTVGSVWSGRGNR